MCANVGGMTSKGLRELIYQDKMNFERATYLQLPTKAFIGFTRCYALVPTC